MMAKGAFDKTSEDPEVVPVSEKVTDWVGVSEGGKAATATEHQLTLLQAFKSYKKAALWSMAVSVACAMGPSGVCAC